MTFYQMLSLFNYGLVLIYGLFLAVAIAGGWDNRQQKWVILSICPMFLIAQSLCWLGLGVVSVKQVYPLLVHLPLVLILFFVLKRPLAVSVVSTCTAYLCCQLPRCINLAVTAITRSPLLGEISYTIVIVPIFLLLRRYFVRSAYDAITSSPTSLWLFGSLPIAYYIFDYATTIYSNALYAGIEVLNEFLPTVIILFYVFFLTLYHMQADRQMQANLENARLLAEQKQARSEMDALRRAQSQTAIYQHDMRHHLNMLHGLLAAGNPQQAEEYIQRVQSDLAAITPKQYCENETVNLLCSSFAEKARQQNTELHIDVKFPKEITISDTELCALLSNGLENALRAVSELPESRRQVELYCDVNERLHKLLIEVKNPYQGQLVMQDGMPVSNRPGHGLGCRSIRTIVRQYGGMCQFDTENHIFTLRILLPEKFE